MFSNHGRRRISLVALFLFILTDCLFGWWTPAATASFAVQSEDLRIPIDLPVEKVVAAGPAVQRIEAVAGPALPGAGAFYFDLDVRPEAMAQAYLVYELAGVPHWTATVRSINGLPRLGGFGAVPSSGTALQVEEINPRWLHAGTNQIVFHAAPAADAAPADVTILRRPPALDVLDAVPYTVRHLRLVYFEGDAALLPRLQVTHPQRDQSDPEGSVVRGFVDPPGLGGRPAELFVDSRYVPGGIDQVDGSFSVYVPRAAADGPWQIAIEVVYPDGRRLRRTIDVPAGSRGDDGGDDEESDEVDADPAGDRSLDVDDARLDISAGAVAGKVRLTMRRLRHDELPALDGGMTNVTPQKRGFRLGPHGTRFRKPVNLRLPYDPELIPKGMTVEDVQTFFFDEAAGRWIALPRIGTEKAKRDVIVSATDHFTDFINATLAVPDDPSGVNHTSNSLQELADANPAASVVEIAPPTGGPGGGASLEYPLIVPPGRRGMEPNLVVRYSSDARNGWLGVGWDLSLSSIEISTSFGVPRYERAQTYLLDGDQLVQTTTPNVFVRRVEGGFEKIERKGDKASNYWWVVTDKDGVTSVYGESAGARLYDPEAPGNIFRWHLERETDLHGNTVQYTYETKRRGAAEAGQPWVEVYPKRIDYTANASQNVPAYYRVEFTLEDRPDRLSSGMQGFKTYMRQRLAKVEMLAGTTSVRQYLFRYQVDAAHFEKSLLSSIAVTGERGAAELYRHSFEYTGMPAQPFSAPQHWTGMSASADVTGASTGGAGAHGFVGVGPPGCQPHAGVQLGGSGTDTTQTVTFLDVNGDGLPDRIDDDGNVDLNTYRPSADPTGVAAGAFRSIDFGSSEPIELGHTSEWSLDFGVGVHAEGFQAKLDTNWVWSHANDDAIVSDLNGDGRPDLVGVSGGFNVQINDGTKFVRQTTWKAPSGKGLRLDRPEESTEVLTNFRLSDALRQLILPYSGRVTIGGGVRKKEAAGDGVEVSIYHGGNRVWTRTIAGNDNTSTCVPGPFNTCGGGLVVDVGAGDSLYFLAGSKADTSGDALVWAPVVTYHDQDPAALEPYGARRFVFDAGSDFALVGSQGAAMRAAATGNVRVSGALYKKPTSDHVTLAVTKKPANSFVEIPVFQHTFAANDETSFEAIPLISVVEGDQLYLRLSSPTPVDPRQIQWAPTMAYEGTTTPAVPDSVRSQPVQVAFALTRLVANEPTTSWTAPATGRHTFVASCNVSTSAKFYVQGVNRLFSVSDVTPGQQAVVAVEADLTAGQPVFFTLLGTRQLSAGECSVLAGGTQVPLNARWPDQAKPKSVLSGGHHGWWYGEWNGNIPFTPSKLVNPDDEKDKPDFVPAKPHWEVTKGSIRPSWTATGFDLYLSAEGAKPSRQGANAVGVLAQASGLSGGALSALRKTSGRTHGVSAELGAGLSGSSGWNETELDLLDMNGDRYPDQVSASGVRFSNGTNGFDESVTPFAGLGSAVRSSADDSVSLTLGGIGLSYGKKGGKGNSRGNRVTLPSIGSTVALSHTKDDLIDVNGDGLPDRVSMVPDSAEVYVQLNLGYRFGAAERWELPNLKSSGFCTDTYDSITSGLATASNLDTLNGIQFTRTSSANLGAAFGPFGASASTSMSRGLVELADINGDGLPDRVVKDQEKAGAGKFRVQLNLGDRWDQERDWNAPDWKAEVGSGYNPELYNCLDAVTFSGHVDVNGSAGAPICIPLVPPVPVVGLQIEISIQGFGSINNGTQLFLEDLDGDGLTDHVLKKSGDSTVYVKRNQAGQVNLLQTIHRPLGSRVDIAYARRGNTVASPSNQWVLASVTVDDKRGNTYLTRYNYSDDVIYDRDQRESFGYSKIEITQPDGSLVTREYRNDDYAHRHLQTKEVFSSGGKIFTVSRTEYTDLAVPGSNGAALFPAVTRETTELYEGTATSEGTPPKSTSRTYQYDTAGNVIGTIDDGDTGSDDDVHTTITYQTGRFTRPLTLTVKDGAGTLLRARNATYDVTTGDLLQLEQVLEGGKDPDGGATYARSKNALWKFTWDKLGNAATTTDPAGFLRTFVWDDTTRTYPAKVTDSFNYVTTFSYDLEQGQVASVTDQNNNTIRRVYDAYGRISRVVGPNDTDAAPALWFEYGLGQPVSWAVVHHKDATRSDPIDSATFIDSLGRIIQTKEEGELDRGTGTSTTRGMRVSGRVTFDAKGRIVSKSEPVFDEGPLTALVNVPNTNATKSTYDPLDRLTKVEFPHGAATTLEYGFATFDNNVRRFLTTRTDPNKRKTLFYSDIQQNVIAVQQTNKVRGVTTTLTTRYDYDALDQLIEVKDAKQNVTTLKYDTLGRNVLLDNPDRGRIESRYDVAGNLGARITPNLAARGQQIRYRYTKGRLDRIEYPQSKPVVFTYGGPGAPFNRAGRIVTVSDESGIEERSYDKLGSVAQLVKTTAALNGATPKGPYTTKFQYDNFGRLLSLVYPDGETLTYGYDAGGKVKSAAGLLAGVRFEYLRHAGYDKFGDRARIVYGNGVETRLTLDKARFLTQLRTIAAGGRDLQNLRYELDLTGTIKSIRNEVPVPASPFYGGPVTQTFQYDDLTQLIGAQGTYSNAPNKVSKYSLALAYDEIGNTISKNQLHQTGNNNKQNVEKKTTYNAAYTYGGRQPHAPTRIGERAFTYDLDGNQTGWITDANGTRRTLTWNEEDRLTSVADNGQTTRFLYDASGTRTNKAGPHGETTYVNRWFSMRNGAIASKHVFADDTRVSTKVSPDPIPPSEKVYFFTTDHAGSTQFVTDELGTVYQHLEYFPSGEAWVDERSETQRTPFLFSGKELDEETGLSYFGARYYDARQGQWISADPVLDGLLETGRLTGGNPSVSPFRLPGGTFAQSANDPINLFDPNGLAALEVDYVNGWVHETWDLSEIRDRVGVDYEQALEDVMFKASMANQMIRNLNSDGEFAYTSVGSAKVKTATQQWITSVWDREYHGERPSSSRKALARLRDWVQGAQDVDEFLTRLHGGKTIREGMGENQGPLLAYINQLHGSQMGALARRIKNQYDGPQEIKGFVVFFKEKKGTKRSKQDLDDNPKQKMNRPD